MLDELRYVAPGWGVGELVFRDTRLLLSEHPRPRPGEPSDHPLARRLAAYFAGERESFVDVELDLDWCTPFQRAVADTLREIPYGDVVTYGELAALAGYPNAQRATGTFCAQNRFAVVVPCHRVVAVNGIGAYGALGVEYKRRLLELEGAVVR